MHQGTIIDLCLELKQTQRDFQESQETLKNPEKFQKPLRNPNRILRALRNQKEHKETSKNTFNRQYAHIFLKGP